MPSSNNTQRLGKIIKISDDNNSIIVCSFNQRGNDILRSYRQKIDWIDNKAKLTILHEVKCRTIADLKKAMMDHDWKMQDRGSVWKWGPLTLQMKGSGSKTGAGYHSPQFNASLSALRKHSPGVFVDGDFPTIISFLNQGGGK